MTAGLVLLSLLLAARRLAAQDTNGPSPRDESVITNMAALWVLPPEEKSRLHRVRLELLIYYCDPTWNVFWGQSDGLDTFLPLRGIPVSLKSGEKILIDGLCLPVNQEFLWDKTTVKILSESNEMKSISATGRLFDTANLDKRFVELEALVDSQRLISSNMLRLDLLAENFNFGAYVLTDHPEAPQPDLTGKFIRIKGVYSESFDALGKIASITLWTPGLNSVEPSGSLATDPRFSLPATSSENFAAVDPTALAHVQGIVRSQQPGQTVTIWDDAGQIRILSKQQHPLELGDRIEAIGYPTFQGIDRVLLGGLFRLSTGTGATNKVIPMSQTKLRLADQVRGLDQESIAKRLPVSLEGVVTWADPQRHFIFILDSSGGVRVMRSQLQDGRRIRTGMMVKVDGVATLGEFAPAITNAIVRQTGTMSLPDPPLISLEEAMTGTEDGRWIQMRGYVRKASEGTNSIQLQLVAPGGEFTARIPKNNTLSSLDGSVVLVRGVCVATANSRRQLTGIQIWSPEVSDVQTEQSPPADLFALPLRSLASLRQFNLFNTLNERVRTRGTITLQAPGRYLCVQEGDNSVLALSSQTNLLRPGDQVEVVGFPGNKGGDFLLREAVYRRVGSGSEPVPAQLPAQQSLNEDLDGQLVYAEGVLFDVTEKPGETHLMIQAKGVIFEAKLDQLEKLGGKKLALGGKLALTGVYRLQRDEYDQPRSFLLNLRDGNDVRILAPPPWWTLSRLLWVLAGTLFVFLLALLWALEIRRKNGLLLETQAELRAARDQLEERVQERTRELSKQIEAKERAHARLSEAQQRLMVASRQAGMAEVATGILHNVGNVLNSVNVSASLVGDSLQRFRVENFSKAATLLNAQDGHLAKFLTQDPRGRALPGYLRDLANAMTENQRNLQNEVKSLIKQIDHVKTIVALQQDYARSSSLSENLDPVEVMEDAVQINRAAYERHGINLVRQYETAPPVFADRHKVLQILINLLSNAKYALEEAAGNKRVVLRIHGVDGDRVRFEVSDTGMGVAPENLERVFTLGFTTRTDGHGFGLHGGANAAKEMGGQLFVLSDGVGQGATFVLELPAVSRSREATKAVTDSA